MRVTLVRWLPALIALLLLAVPATTLAAGTPPDHGQYDVHDVWTSADGCEQYTYDYHARWLEGENQRGYTNVSKAWGEGHSVNTCTGVTSDWTFSDKYHLLKFADGHKEHGISTGTSTSSDGSHTEYKSIFRWDTLTGRYCVTHWWNGVMTWNDCYPG